MSRPMSPPCPRFVPSERIDADVLDTAARVAAASEPFGYRFASTGWFEDEVLYLAPEDPAPFVRLTGRLSEAFPEHPPYGGRFTEITPHLTVARAGDTERLPGVEADVHSQSRWSGTPPAWS